MLNGRGAQYSAMADAVWSLYSAASESSGAIAAGSTRSTQSPKSSSSRCGGALLPAPDACAETGLTTGSK